MKVLTGLLVGAAMIVSGVANAQYYSQASVSGVVLSYGPLGFMLEGPDGNYGIVVNQTTVVTDPWNTLVATGQGGIQLGDYVTATGYPRSQWVLQATRVIDRNANATSSYAPYGGVYGGVFVPGGIVRTPNMFPQIQQGVATFNGLPTPNNTFSPLPLPSNGTFNTLPSPANTISP